MKLEIVSYSGIKDIPFGTHVDDVVNILGEPESKSSNFRKDLIFDYEKFNIGFGKDNVVHHFGFLPGCLVYFEDLELFAIETFKKLVQKDKDSYLIYDTVVLLTLGISFSGFHNEDEGQMAVAAFERGTYDRLQARMKPFQI